jgi:type VI protein secretion system component VasK
MLKTVLLIIIGVSIFGIILFSVVRQLMQRKLNELVEEEKKRKRKRKL